MKRLIENIKDFWFCITHPSYWIMNYFYNKKYDEWFNKLLDENDFEEISEYDVKLGGHIFWIKNQPYACFTSENVKKPHQRIMRPSRRTIYKAIKKLNQWKH